jgi:hypothetical protein
MKRDLVNIYHDDIDLSPAGTDSIRIDSINFTSRTDYIASAPEITEGRVIDVN